MPEWPVWWRLCVIVSVPVPTGRNGSLRLTGREEHLPASLVHVHA